MDACSSVSLTYVVLRSSPFQRTVALRVKPLPRTVRVIAVDPTAINVGLIDDTVGGTAGGSPREMMNAIRSATLFMGIRPLKSK